MLWRKEGNMIRTHLHKEEVNPWCTHVRTTLVLVQPVLLNLFFHGFDLIHGPPMYNAFIEHNTRRPKNAANAPQPTTIIFFQIWQQASLTVVNLVSCFIKGKFLGRDDPVMEKVVVVLNDPVLQQVVAASNGKTVLEWKRLSTLKAREHRKQQYLLVKCMFMNLPTQWKKTKYEQRKFCPMPEEHHLETKIDATLEKWIVKMVFDVLDVKDVSRYDD